MLFAAQARLRVLTRTEKGLEIGFDLAKIGQLESLAPWVSLMTIDEASISVGLQTRECALGVLFLPLSPLLPC